jgi:predicted dehydrogenase
MGLRAGKGVLCEKPFALNEEQARQMVDCARETNCFLMEAMWTRFLPTMATLRTMIADGVIGEPRMVQASFGFRSEFDPKHRLFNPALGGGALLDVGVYCVSFAHMVLGEPREIKAVAALGETGVDEQSSLAMVHEQDALSACTCAIRTMTGRESMVLGTEAYILVEAPWFMGNSLRLVRPKGDPKEEQIDAPMKGNGFNYQIEAASRAMLEGRLETDVMPWEETLAVMRTMDAARAQWGLRYPGE